MNEVEIFIMAEAQTYNGRAALFCIVASTSIAGTIRSEMGIDVEKWGAVPQCLQLNMLIRTA